MQGRLRALQALLGQWMPGAGEIGCGGFARSGAIVALASVSFLTSAGATLADEPTSEVLAERLAGAMRFETISYEDPADFRGAPFVALEAYLKDLYPNVFSTLALEHVNEHSLLFEWKGSDADLQPALFMSHLDVVPVSEAAAAEWSYPPFEGVIADGYVWGRGALDVKSGVILWLEAVDALLAKGVQPKRTIYLAFGHDEEVGGPLGAQAIVARFQERGIHLAFLVDEGGMMLNGHPLVNGQLVASVMTAEKAYMTIELTARGVSGHSSMPPRSTAIGKLSRAIARIEANPMPTRFSLPVREMLEASAPHLPFGRRFAMNNLWLTGPAVKREFLKTDLNAALLRTTFAATLIEGGIKENVIPELAKATVNVRILPGDTTQDVLDHITRAIDDPEIEVRGDSWGEGAPAASVNGLAFQIAKASVQSVIPGTVVLPGLVPGATDSRYFAAVADEIIRFIPVELEIEDTSGAHGRDERLRVEPLARSRAIAVEMVRRAASGEKTSP